MSSDAAETGLLKAASGGPAPPARRRAWCGGRGARPAAAARPPAPDASVLGLPPVPFSRLYSYSTACEMALVLLACAAGAGSGAVLPLFSIIFGSALNAVNDPSADIVASVSALALRFLYIAVAAAALSFTEQVRAKRRARSPRRVAACASTLRARARARGRGRSPPLLRAGADQLHHRGQSGPAACRLCARTAAV